MKLRMPGKKAQVPPMEAASAKPARYRPGKRVYPNCPVLGTPHHYEVVLRWHIITASEQMARASAKEMLPSAEVVSITEHPVAGSSKNDTTKKKGEGKGEKRKGKLRIRR